MNWDIIKGSWKQLRADVRIKWAKLTDDDFEHIGGLKDKLVGKLQERYGHTKDEATTEAEGWLNALPSDPKSPKA